MNDGDINYSNFTARELHEALAGIKRDSYPKNYANILAALGALNEPINAAPAIEKAISADEEGLASRGGRLGAALIDSVIILAIVLPIEYVGGFWQVAMNSVQNHEQIPLAISAPWLLLGIVVLVHVQG
jgi:hypothetical protein